MPATNPRAYHASWRSRNREKLRQKAADYYRTVVLPRRLAEKIADMKWINRK